MLKEGRSWIKWEDRKEVVGDVDGQYLATQYLDRARQPASVAWILNETTQRTMLKRHQR